MQQSDLFSTYKSKANKMLKVAKTQHFVRQYNLGRSLKTRYKKAV